MCADGWPGPLSHRLAYCGRVKSRLFDCPPRERARRIAAALLVAGVIYVPAAVTLAMLLSGNA